MGAVVAAPIGAAMLFGAALPASRRFYENDQMLRGSAGELAYEWLARIPLATATTEELMFRSGLEGILTLRRTPVQAALISAALFGAWHVLPTIDRTRENAGLLSFADRVPAQHGRSVITAIAVTSLASLGLSWLRNRSQSVVAPIVVHAAANMSGVLGVWLAARLNARHASADVTR